MAIVNAWVLYRRVLTQRSVDNEVPEEKALALADFKADVAEGKSSFDLDK